MEALSTYLSYLVDFLQQYDRYIHQAAQTLTVFSFTFALWKWWETRGERRRRARQAEKLARYADAVFEDRSRAALGAGDEEEAAPSRARPRRSRKDAQNDQLIAAFSSVLKNENRKNFWIGLSQNAVFFILGILLQPIMNRLFP